MKDCPLTREWLAVVAYAQAHAHEVGGDRPKRWQSQCKRCGAFEQRKLTVNDGVLHLGIPARPY